MSANNNMVDIREKVVAVIKEVCVSEELDLTDDTKPLFELGLDSLDFSSVLMAIEDVYQFEFSDNDMDKVASVGDICSLIEAKLGR